jgi:hypothetical protein
MDPRVVLNRVQKVQETEVPPGRLIINKCYLSSIRTLAPTHIINTPCALQKKEVEVVVVIVVSDLVPF